MPHAFRQMKFNKSQAARGKLTITSLEDLCSCHSMGRVISPLDPLGDLQISDCWWALCSRIAPISRSADKQLKTENWKLKTENAPNDLRYF